MISVSSTQPNENGEISGCLQRKTTCVQFSLSQRILSKLECVNPLAPKGSERSGEGFTHGDEDIKCWQRGLNYPAENLCPAGSKMRFLALESSFRCS